MSFSATFSNAADDAHYRRLYLLLGLVAIMLGLTVFLLFGERKKTLKPSTNSLALGELAQSDQVDIGLVSAKTSRFISHLGIEELRSAQIAKHQDLLNSMYTPTEWIFGRIRDDAPWWSTRGFFYDGRVSEIAEGPIAEGRWIFNPYALIAPEFWGLSIWGDGNLKWNKNLVTEEMLQRSDFPFAPKASSLVYNPKARRAVITFEVSSFLRGVAEFVTQPLPQQNIKFGITAYNAVDLGFDYIQFDSAASSKVTNPKQAENSRWISDALAFSSDMCGNSDGCNHRNNVMSRFDSLIIESLPAKAVFNLWHGIRREPREPDLVYTIEYR